MKLTPEGKRVWDKPIHPSWMMVAVMKEGAEFQMPGTLPIPQSGMTYGQSVVREALRGLVSNEACRSLKSSNSLAAEAKRCAIALCNKLAEVESEGS